MTDMSAVIIPKSDQINADDLIAGPMTITIREVAISAGQEQPVSIFFDGSPKPYRPCKSMSRVLVAGWGADAKKYAGRRLTLYRDPAVKWGGMEVGGIRISHMSDLPDAMTLALTATKGSRKPYRVLPMAQAAETKPAAKPRQTPEAWANERAAELREIKTPEQLGEWVEKHGPAMAKLKEKDASTWDTLNAMLNEQRDAVAGLELA